MPSTLSRSPLIAVRIYSSVKTNRDVLQGILHYIKENGPWRIHLSEGRGDEAKLTADERENLSGYIGIDHDPEYLPLLRRGVPSILIDSKLRFRKTVGYINCDNAAVARAAAEWLVGHRFQNFAFAGSVKGFMYSDEREKEFFRQLQKLGMAAGLRPSCNGDRLHNWLKSLPVGTAIFATNDIRARGVMNACYELGIDIPRQLSILSVDNDETLCDTTSPGLASIQMTTHEAGYQAAALMDAVLRGRRRISKPVIIPYGAKEVIERQSAVFLPHRDSAVERALDFIKLNFREKISLAQIAKAVVISKRHLENRFNAVMGHGVWTELLNQRLQHASMLIRNTNRTLDDIAEDCAFASASHLSHAFRRHFGVPPSSLRK